MNRRATDQKDIGSYRGILEATVCQNQRQAVENLLFQIGPILHGVGCYTLVDPTVPNDATTTPSTADHIADRNLLLRQVQAVENVIAYLQRLSELGEVISALVLEIKQPLSAISSYASGCRLLAASDRNSEIGHVLYEIIGQVDRASQMLKKYEALFWRLRDWTTKWNNKDAYSMIGAATHDKV